ncbi:MAG: methyltransferase [Candidatus Aenigmarchaeota archaeon]|nr:methyltransferase [Candidatus Aenigmarchaeota archaeon]
MKKLLLVSKEASFIVDTQQKQFSCQYGVLDLTKARAGKMLKSSTGHAFMVVEPTIIDLLRKCRRMPQVVTPKDAAQIAAVTGLRSGWKCLDAGGGSGFLALFIASLVKPGTVTTYEKNKQFAENIVRNVRFCGLDNVVVRNKDARRFTEKNLDLITLDMIGAEKLVKKCHKALEPGGWLCVYSPHIEQQVSVRQAMANTFVQQRTIECTVRDWKIDDHGYTRPAYGKLAHTGFLSFGRKA